jgi:hypothetical protein
MFGLVLGPFRPLPRTGRGTFVAISQLFRLCQGKPVHSRAGKDSAPKFLGLPVVTHIGGITAGGAAGSAPLWGTPPVSCMRRAILRGEQT